MDEEGNLLVGTCWATVFSIPLWISILGWVKILL